MTLKSHLRRGVINDQVYIHWVASQMRFEWLEEMKERDMGKQIWNALKTTNLEHTLSAQENPIWY